jgi:acetyltransferase-like isoleucine patch superfamily enzyme
MKTPGPSTTPGRPSVRARVGAHVVPALRGVRRMLRDEPKPAPGAVYDRLALGRGSYHHATVIAYEGDDGMVRVGSFCSIADGVTFLVGGGHRLDWISTFPFRAAWELEGAYRDGHPAGKGDIVVGNDVWLARDAMVLSGVRIGNGAAVAANAVVTKDVRAYAIVAGNPAREIRRRFSDADVERLEALAWWDWPLEDIEAAMPLLNGGSLAQLQAFAGARGR